MKKTESMVRHKKILIIAGPNGAGKTTFATEFLPREAECPNFINADLIAAGINPFRPDASSIQAAKMMLEMMKKYVEKGESFSFETTLSGKNYARHIPEWQKEGYKVKLYFLRLPDPEFAIARVKQRVKEGGHNVPEDVVRRRYHSGLSNFKTLYKAIVDEWVLIDNAGEWPIFIDEEQDMTDTQTNSAPKKLDDPDIRLAETAIRRAALKARERARRFGHGIIIYENGKMVEKLPDKDT